MTRKRIGSAAGSSLILAAALSAAAQDLSGLAPKEGEKSKIALKEAIMLPPMIHGLLLQNGKLCWEAVAGASALGSGGTQLIKTGTLTQSSTKKDQWSYSSTPTDRLRIVLATGPSGELFVKTFEGTFTNGISGFIENDHKLVYRSKSAEEGDLRLSFVRQGGLSLATCKGTRKIEGVEYTLDLNIRSGNAGSATALPGLGEPGKGDRGFGGYWTKIIETTGTIRGPGFELTVTERLKTETASDDKSSASLFVRSAANQWTLNGNSYELRGTIPKSFKDNMPVRWKTEWQPTGGLTRNGKDFGKLRVRQSEDKDMIEIVLDTPEETVILEALPLR